MGDIVSFLKRRWSWRIQGIKPGIWKKIPPCLTVLLKNTSGSIRITGSGFTGGGRQSHTVHFLRNNTDE
jgi:hypothetical protein